MLFADYLLEWLEIATYSFYTGLMYHRAALPQKEVDASTQMRGHKKARARKTCSGGLAETERFELSCP